MESAEWEALRAELDRAGVSGAEDLGRFVSNVEFFEASAFDEKAAMQVLLDALPRLADARLVSAVAGHLRRPWARPHAFDGLLGAFDRWATVDSTAAWHLGDALGSAATIDRLDVLLRVCRTPEYGTARQMPVLALGRFKKSADVAPVLIELIHDPEVGLHAMGALRRVIGASEALAHVEEVERAHRGTSLGDQAARQAKKLRKAQPAR
ncbi:hypothetical protein [Nocardioides bizhenqiangii]|uniref:HEAT repeat domain-containing protein n=1 Tax=Nocardioides bizhenqiangii TaxID=3095076 RepID=A0ABZ0ZQE4_9ACTN|nr:MULTISPECIES: hypothetical protein [unclassified Nocardioides]MDZ5619535.1 hypothetical protein [Nocardioides sp. HM23]WQQ26448.1 hypothetical protein SHK19_21145 [Nocardioides sp. HM61]